MRTTFQETEILACPKCGLVFKRRFELERHIPIHDPYEERQFGCPEHGCEFRSHQKSGLKTHIRSVHEKVRLPCDFPGCTQTFSDPSSRTRHRQKFHRVVGGRRGRRRQVYANTTTPFSAHEMRPPASHAASSTTVDQPQPPGVPPDYWSNDNNNQTQHQAYNANPGAAPMTWGHPTVPVPSGSSQSHSQAIRTAHDESCRWDSHFGSLTLAPLQGHFEGEGTQAQHPVAFSHSRMGHVPPSDQRWRLPPINNAPSSAYSRPNPRMLFG